MSQCDSTVFNLSLLTADAWGATWSVLLFHQRLTWLYFVAVAVVVVGVALYNTAGFATEQVHAPLTTADGPGYQVVAADAPLSVVAGPDDHEPLSGQRSPLAPRVVATT